MLLMIIFYLFPTKPFANVVSTVPASEYMDKLCLGVMN